MSVQNGQPSRSQAEDPWADHGSDFVLIAEGKPPPRIELAKERMLICRLYLGLMRTITDDYGAEFAAHSDSMAYRTIGIYVFLRTVMCSPVHDLMGEIYDVRSAVEHLHENRYLGEFDRNIRLDLLKKEAVIEHIARTSISRIIDNKALWPHFANTTALGAFWSLSEIDRRAQWGDPIDAFEPMANFDPKYINDAELGGH